MLFFLYKSSTYKKCFTNPLSLPSATHNQDAFGPHTQTAAMLQTRWKVGGLDLLSEKTSLPIALRDSTLGEKLKLKRTVGVRFDGLSGSKYQKTYHTRTHLTLPYNNVNYGALNATNLVRLVSQNVRKLRKTNYFLSAVLKKINANPDCSIGQNHPFSYIQTRHGPNAKIWPHGSGGGHGSVSEISHYCVNERRSNRSVRQSLLNYYGYMSSLKIFPAAFYMPHHKFLTFQRKIQRHTKNSKEVLRYYGRHSSSIFNARLSTFRAGVGGDFFASWNVRKFGKSNFKEILKLLWRFFKLKLERFFFKMLGVRTHVWFLSVWQVFLAGIACKNSWDYFEAKKIVEYTRRGHRYVIEYSEDAKFFIRIMVVMFTFVGGIRVFLDRISDWMAQFRNHWAYVRYIAETVRKCSNFFWFRFFMNYRLSIQGKVGGQLRAQKKIYNRGTIRIEDWSSMVGYHKAYSNTKFGIFNLSMWLQFKVPNIVETFGGHELVTTMQILLSRYSIPWLAERLAHVVASIDHDEKVKKSFSKRGGAAKVGAVKRIGSKYPLGPIQYRVAVRNKVNNKLGIVKRA